MNWIGIIQIVLIIGATGVSARGSQPNGRAAGIGPARLDRRVERRMLDSNRIVGRVRCAQLFLTQPCLTHPGLRQPGLRQSGLTHPGLRQSGLTQLRFTEVGLTHEANR
jgi:hypothetical protein